MTRKSVQEAFGTSATLLCRICTVVIATTCFQRHLSTTLALGVAKMALEMLRECTKLGADFANKVLGRSL